MITVAPTMLTAPCVHKETRTKRKCYAVARGRRNGIFWSWPTCRISVSGYTNARFKSFSGPDAEVVARRWLTENRAEQPATHRGYYGDGPKLFVYTDGSCRHNGTRKAIAGIGVYFAEGDERNVSRRFKGRQTNNTAEVTAILEACSVISEELKKDPTAKWTIVTDSQYAISYATCLGARHASTDWAREIPNRVLVRRLYNTISHEPRISLQKVAAHTNMNDVHSIGNAAADRLAYHALDTE